MMHTPDEWAPPVLAKGPHDHKGYSEEKCVRCGWVMGHWPLNCMNDDTPHRFPSQEAEIERLRHLIRAVLECDGSDHTHYVTVGIASDLYRELEQQACRTRHPSTFPKENPTDAF